VVGYDWLDGLEAFCFTAVVGLDRDETVRRLGGDPQASQVRTFDECFWAADGPQWAQVAAVDTGVLVAEHNGWRGEEAVVALSRGARLACFFRNVQAVMHFVYAVDGAVVAEFDPLLQARPTDETARQAIAAELSGLRFGLFAAEPSALSLLERLTGVQVRPTWLSTPQPAVALPPLR
jgi:Family of unknown function (DUF6461)